jgi:hypothetical protein
MFLPSPLYVRNKCPPLIPITVFVNLYYEFNYLLDFVFSEKSNLECAAYGDVHTAAENLTRGGRHLTLK